MFRTNPDAFSRGLGGALKVSVGIRLEGTQGRCQVSQA